VITLAVGILSSLTHAAAQPERIATT